MATTFWGRVVKDRKMLLFCDKCHRRDQWPVLRHGQDVVRMLERIRLADRLAPMQVYLFMFEYTITLINKIIITI